MGCYIKRKYHNTMYILITFHEPKKSDTNNKALINLVIDIDKIFLEAVESTGHVYRSKTLVCGKTQYTLPRLSSSK